MCKHTRTDTRASSLISCVILSKHIHTDKAKLCIQCVLLIHTRTEHVKSKLVIASNVLASSPLLSPFMFSHLLFFFVFTLFSLSTHIKISFSIQSGPRAVPLLNHYQKALWRFRQAPREWCNRDTTKQRGCKPGWADWGEVGGVPGRPDIKSVASLPLVKSLAIRGYKVDHPGLAAPSISMVLSK